MSAGIAVFLGWFFKPMRWFIPLGVCLAYLAVDLYVAATSKHVQTASSAQIPVKQPVGGLCGTRVRVLLQVLFAYIVGAIAAVRKMCRPIRFWAWVPCLRGPAMAGFVVLLACWHESYLLRPDAGHIPVSNLTLFILFFITWR